MDEILAAVLSAGVHDRLNHLNNLADTEIVRLSETVREMLVQHEPDSHGRCRQCSGWFRRRRHPCSVWTVAHQQLIGPITRRQL